MSFPKICSEIRIEVRSDCTIFHACVDQGIDEEARWCYSRITLDDKIGNNNGQFSWGGQGFTKTAKALSLEFRDGNPWLIAGWLQDSNGNWGGPRSINLAEHVGVKYGCVAFI